MPPDVPAWYDNAFDPYCLEAGRVTAFWAELELSLDRLIWEMMDVHAYVGMCLTRQMIGPAPRLRAILSLLDVMHADEEIKKEFKKFGSDIESLGAKRNRYAHDTVSITVETRNIIRTEVTADRKFRYVQDSILVEEIRILWIEINNAKTRLGRLRKKLKAGHPGWATDRYLTSVANPDADGWGDGDEPT